MKHCIISFQDNEIIEKMTDLGYICHNVITSDRVSSPISCHSDVLYQKMDYNTFTVSSCQKANLPVLQQAGYSVVFYDGLKPGYETESLLNFIINKKYVIYNPKTALNIDCGKTEIIVKQGYTKCSTVCVNENAYITDDKNIYSTLIKNNIDCLKISKGDISLPGYDYGFIGGASVKLNDKEILFFGDISNKTDKKAVIEFLNKYNVKPIFMENKKLIDIGSAIIL